MTRKLSSILVAIFPLVCASACASKPAAPFDTMPQGNLIAFRLQNFEPPAPAAGAPAPGATGLIPGLALPPEIQSWVQQGAAGLSQLLPPGLIPPGMLPGAPGAATAAPPPVASAPRFPTTTPNFRILGQTQITDQDLKDELAKLFGKEGNYDNHNSACLYAELGLTWQGTGVENDVLVSFSCNQVQGRGFAWPFPSTGMTPGMVKDLSELVQKIFPPGT